MHFKRKCKTIQSTFLLYLLLKSFCLKRHLYTKLWLFVTIHLALYLKTMDLNRKSYKNRFSTFLPHFSKCRLLIPNNYLLTWGSSHLRVSLSVCLLVCALLFLCVRYLWVCLLIWFYVSLSVCHSVAVLLTDCPCFSRVY